MIEDIPYDLGLRRAQVGRTCNDAFPFLIPEVSVKKNLHPGAIASVVAVLVIAAGFLLSRAGTGDVKGVSMEEAMKITSGNKVNSFTGEPLTESQKVAAANQDAQIAAMRAAQGDPQSRGTAPNFGGRRD